MRDKRTDNTASGKNSTS